VCHQFYPDVETKFYSDLQALLDSVPKTDLLILMGDFNASGSTTRILCGMMFATHFMVLER